VTHPGVLGTVAYMSDPGRGHNQALGSARMNFYISDEMVQALMMPMRPDSTESTTETVEREPRFLDSKKQEPPRRSEAIHKLVNSDSIVALVSLATRWLL
jgi:hypothetical protein